MRKHEFSLGPSICRLKKQKYFDTAKFVGIRKTEFLKRLTLLENIADLNAHSNRLTSVSKIRWELAALSTVRWPLPAIVTPNSCFLNFSTGKQAGKLKCPTQNTTGPHSAQTMSALAVRVYKL